MQVPAAVKVTTPVLLSSVSDAGIDGMALGLVNYITELPHLRDGVLPRLERMGLRQPAHQ